MQDLSSNRTYESRLRTQQRSGLLPKSDDTFCCYNQSLEEERMNHKISSDRMVVEDYFGLWWICSDKFRWGVTLYDDIVRACLVLTNAHAGVRPLRTQDADYYHGRENSLVATRQEMRAKRRLAQTKHLNKKKRLESDFSQV
ncbi:hypothetical protein FI667_g774, partial [Globisporangium splendens]